MSTGRHSLQNIADGIHISHAYEYANASARTGAIGFVAGDVGKLAKQTDTLTWWVLVDTSPTWKEITPGAVSETTTTLTESPADVFTYTSEDSTVTEIDISDFETTTELNTRDTNNRDRANHTSTQTASTISDFDTEVSNNTDVTANTAKVTNATHTGEVTGSSALTVDSTAISNKALKSSPSGSEEVLINDGGVLKKTTAQDIADLGGGGGSRVGDYLDRAAWTDNNSYINTSADYTTDSANAVPIDVVHTPSNSGTYLITLDVLWSVDTGTFDQQSELLCDNGGLGTSTTVRWRYRVEPKDAAGTPDDSGSAGTDQRFPATLRYLHTATAATAFNIIFRHRPTDAGIESTIKASVLTIERWS